MEYVDFEINDIDELVLYYGKYLNDGDELLSFIKDAAGKETYFGSKAVENGKTAGFFTFQEGVCFTCPHESLTEKIHALTDGEKTVTVDTLLVLPEMRFKGIAGNLRKRNAFLLKERGISFVLAESWVYPDGRVPSFKVYEDMGSIIYDELFPMFYKDLDKYGISCPICGKVCRCGARILLIDVR